MTSPDCPCGCCNELREMMLHADTDFDYKRACHCAGYAEEQRCDCEFCTRMTSLTAKREPTATNK